MKTSTKVASSIVFILAVVLLVRHGDRALHPAVPRDMPSDSHFVMSSYDLQRNEFKGNWVACSAYVDQSADFCRVTDSHGAVIYQGEFLPLQGDRAVLRANLRFAAVDPKNLFVRGPAEYGPVPVIPLA